MTSFDQLGNGIFRRRYESLDLNIGVVVGEDGVLIVDTRATHQQGQELEEELRTLTKKKVRWVVNTHWHWDHVFGNRIFSESEIWGHELTKKALTARGQEMKDGAKEWLPTSLHHLIDEVEVVPPDRSFSSAASVSIGRAVELEYFGMAHTDSDITISVEDSAVTFMGDIIEEGAPPGFGDSYPESWPTTLSAALERAGEVLVPGHGDVVDRGFATEQLAQLTDVARVVREVREGTVDRGKALVEGPFPEEVMTSILDRAESI